MRAKIVPDASAGTVGKFLTEHVEVDGTKLMTDNANIYKHSAHGYIRQSVNHKKQEWARGDVYVNTMESFWSHIKRSIKGTHKVVSKKHLQAYLDGFVFHYNNRYSDRARFGALLGTILLGAE